MCAHAVSVAVEKIEGVTSVEVSLNEGFADIGMAPANTITLRSIRDVVRKNGFTIREARIRVRGMVSPRDGSVYLDVPSSHEVFVLQATDAMLSLVPDPTGLVTIVGIVPAPTEREATSQLRVTELLPEGH